MPSTSTTLALDVQTELGFGSGCAATGTIHTLNLVARDGIRDLATGRYMKRRRIATRRARSEKTTSIDELLSETLCQHKDSPEPLETSDTAGAAAGNYRNTPILEVRVPGLRFPKSTYIGYKSPLHPVAESRVLKELLVCKRCRLMLRC